MRFHSELKMSYQYAVIQLHRNNINSISTFPADSKGFEFAKCYFHNLVACEIEQSMTKEESKKLAEELVPVLPMVAAEFFGVDEDNNLLECCSDSYVIKFEIAEFYESKNL